jgi:signal transduction histidine kinase
VATGVIVDALLRRVVEIAVAEGEARAATELARAQLEAASRHKSEFLASMSHELRTPLNAVLGFSDVLLSRTAGELNDDQAEFVADIRASGAHLLELINDVLDLSKVEAGRLEVDRRTFALGEVIAAAANLVRPRAEAGRIAVVVDVAPSAAEAYGDERRVKQVLVNLLGNAVKFTPPGGRIAVRAWADEAGSHVAVADDGVGIAPEDQAAIFDDFAQVGDAALAREGTGLGLALARRLLELHGGAIAVESALGVGSTFTVTLPPAPAEVAS